MWRNSSFRTRVALVVSVIVLLGQTTVFMRTFFGSNIDRFFNARSFDLNLWKNRAVAMSRDRPVRSYMAEDLMRQHDLLGKSTTEIGSLLGTPDDRRSINCTSYDLYWLGPSRSFIKLDSEWLAIRFDQDKVVDVRILDE
jgi:hypothetical protein